MHELYTGKTALEKLIENILKCKTLRALAAFSSSLKQLNIKFASIITSICN